MSEIEPSSSEGAGPAQPEHRVFLVVIDESEEMRNALRFACRRAQHTRGRVALLYVIEPVEFQHWLGVGRMMEAEARSTAEQRVQTLAAEVFAMTGTMPVIHIKEGERSDALAELIRDDPTISLLVLATAIGGGNPGPLVTYLLSNFGRKIRIPVTLVPGELTTDEIDALS
jgi:nucleotide-binding universal stress UspA family protein